MAEPNSLCSANGCFMPSDRSRSSIESLYQRINIRNHFAGLNGSSTAASHDVLSHSALACARSLMTPVEQERAKCRWGSFQFMTMGLSTLLVDFSLIVLDKQPVCTKSGHEPTGCATRC